MAADKTKRLLSLANGQQRVRAFLAAFRDSNHDADLKMHIGYSEKGGIPAVIISFDGEEMHVLTSAEARSLAKAMEESLCVFPEFASYAANTIMALRYGADQADERFGPDARPATEPLQ